MAVNLSPVGGVAAQFFDNSGNVLTGGKIYTYAAGTTTPQITYTTSAGNIPQPNPIILNASGRVPGSGEIWLTDGILYKFVLTDSNDVLIATYDNISGINSNFVAFTNQQEIQTATAGQTVFNFTTMTYQPGTNSLSVFVDGVNQYGPGAQYAYLETDSDTVTFLNGLHVGALVKFTTSQLNSGVGQNAAQTSFTGFKGQAGNVQDLADDDGSDWIGFEQAGTGAVAISAQDKMRQIFSVKDYGAVADDVTDDATAFQAALDALIANGGGALFVPAGKYRIKTQLTVTCDAQQHISIYGEGRYQSTLDFSTDSSLGIYFHSTSTAANQLPVFEVSDIGLITSHDNCGTALDFEYDSSQNIDASVNVSNVLIAQNVDRVSDSGTGYGYWTTGVQMTNARNSEITNLHAYGEMDKTPNSTYGVQITGETTAFVFTDSLLLEWTTGLNAVGTSEGVYLNNTDIVYCRYGAQHRFATGAEPQFTAVGCSFNTSNVGVWLENSQQSVIADCLFYAASVLDDPGPWPEYKGVLINGTNSRFNKVTGCTFSKENQRTGDTTTGIDFNVGSHYSASGNHFFGFNGNLYTFGVQVRSGVDSVVVGDDNIFQYVSSPTSFASGCTKTIRQPVIQSGGFTASNGGTVTFPMAFTSVQSVVLTHNGTNTMLIATASSLSNTGFTFNCNTPGSINMFYIATGFI